MASKEYSLAALYCIYEDCAWLDLSYESVYPAVNEVLFFVSYRPWNGPWTDNSAAIRFIENLPDPQQKKTIFRGPWTNEVQQRNYSFKLAQERGHLYGMIVDGDEIYDGNSLKMMFNYALTKPDVDSWHMYWITYWKSPMWRIFPPEPYTPPVFVKFGTSECVEARNIRGQLHAAIPPEVGFCHHLSYARDDSGIIKKLSQFTHAQQIIPGWYKNVWKAWDQDHALQNLHPINPQEYKEAVAQSQEFMPPVLQKWLSEQLR